MKYTTDKTLYLTNHAISHIPYESWPKELVQDLCAKRGIEYRDGFEGRVLEMNVAEAGVDRAGRQIVLEGGRYEEYSTNPIVLWIHNEEEFYGYSLRERIEGGLLKSLILFLPPELTKKNDLFLMVKSGVPRASSICIRPIVIEQIGEAIVIQTWQMVEISLCNYWITTEDFGELYYNDLITKERIGKVNGIWFVVFPNETGLEPPHFHVMEGKDTKLASVDIETGKIFVGKENLNARQRAITKAWFEENQAWARERWNATRPG